VTDVDSDTQWVDDEETGYNTTMKKYKWRMSPRAITGMTGFDLNGASCFQRSGLDKPTGPIKIHGDYSPVAEADAILAHAADRDLALA